MKKYIFFLFVVFLIVFEVSAQERINFQHFSIDDGLSQGTITCTLQDKKGFLWFGTRDGLNRFDGNDFKIYKKHSQDSLGTISSNYLLALCESKNGYLWIGTNAGGLNRFDYANETFKSYTVESGSGLKNNNIWAVLEDKKGIIWLGTDDGWLHEFDPITEKMKTYLIGDKKPIYHLAQDNSNFLWLASSMGLGKFDKKNKTFKLYQADEKNANGLTTNKLESIVPTKNNSLWIASSDGLYLFDIQKETFKAYKHEINNPNSLSHDHLTTCFEDKKGILWIGSVDGLNKFDPQNQQFTIYKKDLLDINSLSHNRIISIYEDKSGIIWVGTGAKLEKFDSKSEKFKSYKNDASKLSLNGQKIWSVFEDKEGIIWLGTDNGLQKLDRKNGMSKMYSEETTKQELANNRYFVCEDDKNTLWAGSYKGELVKFDRKKEKFELVKSDLLNNGKSNRIKVIVYGKDKMIWLGTDQGLICYNPENQEIKVFQNDPKNPNSLPSNKIYSLSEGENGVWWIGFNNGQIASFDSKNNVFKPYHYQFLNFGKSESNTIFSICITQRGLLWIASNESGLTCFNPKTQKVQNYLSKDGLPSDVISSVLEDTQGNIWISTQRGISKFDPKTESFKNYDVSDGLQANDFAYGACFKSQSGEVFFGGIVGLNAFFPEKIKDNPLVPAMVFTDFLIFNKPVKVGQDSPLKKSITEIQEITLNYTDYVFTVKFAALNFSNTHKNQYAYKLDNFEKEWNYVGSKREATYTNLDAGTYILRVKGTNNDGIWNEKGISLRIRILPPWWETWWFRTLATIFVFTVVYVWYKDKIRRVESQKRELERQVKERTFEVVKQKEEIETKNSELLQQQEEILAQAENVKSANEALQITYSEIKIQKEEIESQRDKLEETNLQIAERNTKIMDSIRYAQTIQQAMLPFTEKIAKNVKDFFIIFRPKDIVSGDFYWFSDINEKIIMAAVDCTGHGIPGAFMSMIGISLLDEIVDQKEIFDPALILENLNQGIRYALKQDEELNKDGMDVCLAVIERGNDEYKINYSGAYRPLIYCKEGKIMELKGDKKRIGGKQRENKTFTSQTLYLKENDCLYLTTDGFIDQNGANDKKMGSVAFFEILQSIADRDMKTQKEILVNTLVAHQGKEIQRDDITLVGLKF